MISPEDMINNGFHFDHGTRSGEHITHWFSYPGSNDVIYHDPVNRMTSVFKLKPFPVTGWSHFYNVKDLMDYIDLIGKDNE